MPNKPIYPILKLQAKLLIDVRSELGESALWNHFTQELLWVDIDKGLLHSYDPALHTHRTTSFDREVSMIAIANPENLILAFADGIYNYKISNQELSIIRSNPEKDTTGNRFNDGKCDASGRLWLGTMGGTQSAALYCLDAQHKLKTMLTAITTSNGITWSADQQSMYYIDSDTSTVKAYNFEPETGRLSNPRVAISIPKAMGIPDGSAMDTEGMIWVALWGGYGVARWNPLNGILLATIAIPAKNVTSCAFGGEQLDQLYITTARTQNSAEELAQYPHSGGVFVAEPGVTGMQTNLFQNKYDF